MDIIGEINHFIDNRLTQEVGKGLLKFFLKAYSNEGYYSNGSFVPWVNRVNEHRYKRKKLYKTGAMKSSFQLSYPSYQTIQLVNTAQSANGFDYPEVHNNGSGKIPARPFLYHDDAIEDEVDRLVIQELNRFFKNLK